MTARTVLTSMTHVPSSSTSQAQGKGKLFGAGEDLPGTARCLGSSREIV